MNLHWLLQLSLNVPLWKLFGWFRSLQLWTTHDWQLHHDTCLLMDQVSCRVFWWNTKSPRWLSPLQPRFGELYLLSFPKTKIPFKREEISDHCWDSGKYDGAADGDGENCVKSQGAYFEGDCSIIVLCTMFLLSYIFFNTCLYFS